MALFKFKTKKERLKKCFDKNSNNGVCYGLYGGDNLTGNICYSCIGCPYLKIYVEDKTTSEKDKILKLLANENVQVLSLAYLYAKNMFDYGEDVTKAFETATQQSAMLEKAYQKGYADCLHHREQIL